MNGQWSMVSELHAASSGKVSHRAKEDHGLVGFRMDSPDYGLQQKLFSLSVVHPVFSGALTLVIVQASKARVNIQVGNPANPY